MISVLKEKEEGVERIDYPMDEPSGQRVLEEAKVLGWWKWKVKKKPPSQKELNERLEQLYLSLRDSTLAHKDTLIWLVGLYLTRKKILRQEQGCFVHVKSLQRTLFNQEAMEPSLLEKAIGDLLAVIQ